ncbi:hypothetical protein JSO59_011100 [Riemerella anatipestifer]|uniref:hypothetical protein n=1 Tax=Riemerella anatipestifer TaxID=34085 RepID=UPI0030C2A75C
MRKTITIIGLFSSSYLAFSQVILGEGKTEPSSSSISLEFGNENKGIVLPWVNNATTMSNAVSGTLVLDVTDRKVKVKLNKGWQEVTPASTVFINTTLQDGIQDKTTTGAVIGGDGNTSTPGVLVLEDANKAMQLPMVASPHLNIVKPAAGMLAYDTVSKLVCIYNGSEWAFWKPE